jgi:hypothetical protein
MRHPNRTDYVYLLNYIEFSDSDVTQTCKKNKNDMI